MTGFGYNLLLGGAQIGVPTHSIDFENSSSQYLSMSNADWGAYDRALFAISLWYKRESAVRAPLYYKGQSAGIDLEFGLEFNTSNKIQFVTWTAGGLTQGGLVTTATYTDTASWHHILAHYDSANATPGDRMRLWHDGTEVTAFDQDTNPSAAAPTYTGQMFVGRKETAYNDGLIYQGAFFSGSLPAIGDVYNAGSPKDLRQLTGLYSLLNCVGGVVTTDYVRPAWTNNNSLVSSTTIPT